MNGVEVERLNMPAGRITHTTEADTAGEPTLATVTVPRDLLVAGSNVVAVSVHNASAGSSDLSFDAMLGVAARAQACSPTFSRGDINGDGGLNVADVITLLGSLFSGQAPPACRDAADGNDDGTLNVADAITILGHLFGNAGDLPPPFGVCGPDPTDDELDCEAFPQCE